jgi:hypothetical protein
MKYSGRGVVVAYMAYMESGQRDYRGDWSLETVVHTYDWGGGPAVRETTTYLGMMVTSEQMNELMRSSLQQREGSTYAYRGTPSFQYQASYGNLIAARGIEVTPEEVEKIRCGAHPLDVLFDWAELGYRLFAVPDPLSRGN